LENIIHFKPDCFDRFSYCACQVTFFNSKRLFLHYYYETFLLKTKFLFVRVILTPALFAHQTFAAYIKEAFGLDVSHATLSLILKSKDRLKQAHADGNDYTNSRTRQRASPADALNQALAAWCHHGKHNEPLTDAIIKDKAKEIAESIDGFPTDPKIFNFSSNWLQKFKKRYLSIKEISDEDPRDPTVKPDRTSPQGSSQPGPSGRHSPPLREQEQSSTGGEAPNWGSPGASTFAALQFILRKFCPADVFVAHETGFFFRDLPTEDLFLMQPPVMPDGRIAAILCCNSEGTQKRPLAFAGKVGRPAAFRKSWMPRDAGVDFFESGGACFTAASWVMWIQEFNREMSLAHRHVALLVDCSPACAGIVGGEPFEVHNIHGMRLSNVTLIPFPPSIPRSTRPMEQGIAAAWTARVRMRHTQWFIHQAECNRSFWGGLPFSVRPTVREAIQWSVSSWAYISPVCVLRSWWRSRLLDHSLVELIPPRLRDVPTSYQGGIAELLDSNTFAELGVYLSLLARKLHGYIPKAILGPEEVIRIPGEDAPTWLMHIGQGIDHVSGRLPVADGHPNGLDARALSSSVSLPEAVDAAQKVAIFIANNMHSFEDGHGLWIAADKLEAATQQILALQMQAEWMH